jgi:hypothetical protein
MVISVQSELIPICLCVISKHFKSWVDKAISPRRALLILLGGFAVFALFLASLGIYTVISYSVSQRVQEIEIRMALGASSGDLQSRIMLRTLSLTAFGLALGLAGSQHTYRSWMQRSATRCSAPEFPVRHKIKLGT